ncbi:alpha/beta hydrolase [Microlunatus sp. GCM10028923]|uniref:alpha/beta hydrolase n=1 Tax=Microlunatus sp. GCM10028923 TaxID=3273400 RepID=UPI0036169CCF
MAEPDHLRPFVLDVAPVSPERLGRIDVYRPGPFTTPRPAVVLVHGGPLPADLRPAPRDWPVYQGYGAGLAHRGLIGITLDHRLHDRDSYPSAAADLAAAVDQVRGLDGVDSTRLALWFFSGGGPLAADWLADPPAWLRAVALTYPVLGPRPGRPLPVRFQPGRAITRATGPPVLITRVGREQPAVAATVAEFLAAADAAGRRVEVIDVSAGRHGFDSLDHDAGSRGAVEAALSWVAGTVSGG